MHNPIPEGYKKIWEDWNIRGVMLFSLFLQIFLILFAPLRKGTSNKLIIMLIWSVYLLADWAANFAVGLISNTQGDSTTTASSSKESSYLLSLWPPFLLIHLGGPDTITAFALEDNELWLRHALGLFFQVIAAAYVFLQALPQTKLAFPTLLVFVAGIIKYLERTRALYLASLDKFRDSMLKDPDPGPNYAKLMDDIASKKEANLPTTVIMIEEQSGKKSNTRRSTLIGERDGSRLRDLDVVHHAYHFFDVFKGLIVDLIFSFHERNESRDFFINLSPEDALRVIEVELNFIYDALYSKVQVVHSRFGYSTRFISFASVVAALLIFHFKVNKIGFDGFDVGITYALFLGAIALEIVAFLMLCFSDWTFAEISDSENGFKLKIKSGIAATIGWFLILKRPKWYNCHQEKQNCQVLATPFLFRRWSGHISGHNLIRYCLKGRPKNFNQVKNCVYRVITKFIPGIIGGKGIHFIQYLTSCRECQFLCFIYGKVIQLLGFIIQLVINYIGLTDFVDEIRFLSHEPLTKPLWEFIFNELSEKSRSADEPENARKISAARGNWILERKDYRHKLLPYVTGVTFDESLLLWHIATELLYQTEEEATHEEGNINNYNYHRQFSKILSDYMLYLLVVQTTMISVEAGIGKIRFRDTCAEAKRLFRSKKLGANEEEEACEQILSVNTYVEPVKVKGDRSKSVLFDASMLAQVLNKMDDLEEGVKEDKWELLSKIWVELLSYAACNCIPRTHAQEVSKGGELITFVWLLMAHFGLGEQFQINKGQGRTKLIIGT
ncbi:hypothetical protein Ddye_026958 [Dipteronia dyeriana]|uniref:DUF4220 domain-containing protein n=1 Tax=Dipteronia dyeriana TaxID=168575 RepID=A0AAD9TNM7_9ROSI|nr:hypothetical protein Ddye_026958 [Dipteronia dyeriana]